VDVIVWRGTVQGLETRRGCGGAARIPGGCGSSSGRSVRPRLSRPRTSSALAAANALGVILGDSLPGGLIGDGVLGLLTLLVVGLMRLIGIRGRVRIPAPPPKPARVPGLPSRPSVNARKRQRPRRRG
jgi:hypothetical protein